MVSQARKLRWRESARSMMQAVMLALAIRTFLIQAYKIPSSSMETTLFPGDHIFVAKFLYGFKIPFTRVRVLNLLAPRRGDIIVFQAPHEPQKDYIKRCIALPGERFRMDSQEKTVYVNDTPLEESRHALYRDARPLPPGSHSLSAPYNESDGPLPPGHYMMLGDNRDNSKDSRSWGSLPESYIKGKALFMYWPLHRIRWLR